MLSIVGNDSHQRATQSRSEELMNELTMGLFEDEAARRRSKAVPTGLSPS